MPSILKITRSCISLILAVALTSCSGYTLGTAKPKALSGIDNIYIPIVENKTQVIKLSPQVTNSLTRAINSDGSYEVTNAAQADATLKVVIKTVDYDEFRSSRLDTLLAEELTATIQTSWKLIDNQSNVLLSGSSSGSTRFFQGSNQRLSRDDSTFDAVDNLARNITSRISHGF